MARPGQWIAGQSGNPHGRPIGARQKVAEKLIADIADVWEEHGRSVLERLALTDPAALAKIAYGLLPREMLLNVQQSGAGIDAERWALVRPLLVAIEAASPAGEPEEIVRRAEQAIRAEFATPIASATE